MAMEPILKAPKGRPRLEPLGEDSGRVRNWHVSAEEDKIKDDTSVKKAVKEGLKPLTTEHIVRSIVLRRVLQESEAGQLIMALAEDSDAFRKDILGLRLRTLQGVA